MKGESEKNGSHVTFGLFGKSLLFIVRLVLGSVGMIAAVFGILMMIFTLGDTRTEDLFYNEFKIYLGMILIGSFLVLLTCGYLKKPLYLLVIVSPALGLVVDVYVLPPGIVLVRTILLMILFSCVTLGLVNVYYSRKESNKGGDTDIR